MNETVNVSDNEPIPDHYFIYERIGRGSNTRWDFVRRPLNRCVCGDCGCIYDPETWVEDEDSDGNPMLVCECGGQMYSTKEG